MRLLLFNMIAGPGGVTTGHALFIPGLKERGIDVFVIDANCNDEYKSLIEESGGQILTLPIWPRVVSIGWDVWYRRVAATLLLGPAYLLYIIRLALCMREHKISVVWSDLRKSQFLAALSSRLARVPFVYHLHGLNDPKDITLVDRIPIALASVVVAVSNDCRDKLLAAGAGQGKTRLLYNGVSLTGFSTATELLTPLPQDNSAFKICIASNVQAGKGIHVGIAALAELMERGVDAVLWIAGRCLRPEDEKHMETLQQLARNLRVQDRVHFIGWRKDIAGVMLHSDVVIQPSTVAEGFGRTVAEAMALGRPVVVSRRGALKELVEEDVSGLAFDSGDASDLAAKLYALSLDKELCWNIGQRGRMRINQYFSRADYIEGVHKIAVELAEK